MTEQNEQFSRGEHKYSPEYAKQAQHYAERFVNMLSAQGFTDQQISTVLGQVQSSFGMDAEQLQKPPVSSPQDQAPLKHATDWVAEVNSRAQFYLFNKAGQDPKLVPSVPLTTYRPSNRKA
jgi:hypothetical protein